MTSTKKLTLEIIIERLKSINPNVEILSEKYLNSKTKLVCKCKKCNNIWETCWRTLGGGTNCPVCSAKLIGEKTRLKFDYVKERILHINPNIEILSKEYSGTSSVVLCRCKKDGYIWNTLWKNILYGRTGCPVCARVCVHDGNRISIKRPDVLKFLVDKSDGDKHSIGSSQKIKIKCPDCGRHRKRAVYAKTLCQNGFSCQYCGDGFSNPERLMREVLKLAKIDFEAQYSPSWAGRKSYDFYFDGKIIETHGMQHYQQMNRSMLLRKQKENDNFKIKMAMENGILFENYIIVDCRYSTFDFLKENFIKALSDHINLSGVCWEEAWEKSQNNIVLEVCRAWEKRDKDHKLEDIAEIFDIHRHTVLKYLKTGSSLGFCSYSSKEEKIKNAIKNGLKNSKKVYQYTIDGKFVKSYNSVAEANRIFKTSSISKCCLGKRKTSCGYKWSYEKSC